MITLHGFLLSALMAIGQLLINRRSPLNIIYFGLFLDFSLFEIDVLLFEAGLISNNGLHFRPSIPAIYLLGPLLYLLARISLHKGFRLRREHMVHFIPLAVSLVLVFAGINLLSPRKTFFLPGYFYNSLTMAAGMGGSLTLFVYLVMIWRMIFSSALWKRELLKREPVSRITFFFFLMVSLSWITDFLSVIHNDLCYIEISITLLTFIIIFLFLVNFIYPDFYRRLHRVVEEEKERRSYLAGLDLESLDQRLDSVMTDEELYTREDITLNTLADILEITPHQLSEFINNRFQKNFTTYINEFRVNKAKDLLLKDNRATILAVAYEVGFKSKSRFNAVFLKHTGETPSRFRKRKG